MVLQPPGTSIAKCSEDSFLFLELMATRFMIEIVSVIAGCRRGQWTDDANPPRSTTVHDDRQIVLMAIMDRAATSRAIAQLILSVTHHSVTALTTRRRLQQSGMYARHPLLRLPLGCILFGQQSNIIKQAPIWDPDNTLLFCCHAEQNNKGGNESKMLKNS
ncbi:hypothetical protein TNCV_297131 [Trichonephila clavipes]|nr:hypothetical protein TNCV_297131 [Trichonephila clavipes]